jgi:septal ring factor EnvC (AmiA/AmiB activator)
LAERDARDAERALASVEAGIADLSEERRVAEGKLAERVRALYKFGRVGYVQVLFSSKDYQDFARRSRFLRRIIEADAELVEEFRGRLAALGTERGRLDGARRVLEDRRQAAAARRGDVEARRGEKVVLIAKLQQEKDTREEELRDLERSAAELQGVFARLREAEPTEVTLPEVPRGAGADSAKTGAGKIPAEAPHVGEVAPVPFPGNGAAFSLLRGRLPLPAEGRIVKRFGLRTDPELGTQIRSNGITVRAPFGAPIHAVADGRVLYAGWFRGYGRILIIDHGQGYYTLVAHASELLRRVGDSVHAGEEIARVGDSGSLEGPILYFEIRKEGKPVDPKDWIRS